MYKLLRHGHNINYVMCRCITGERKYAYGEERTEEDFATQIIDLIVGEVGIDAHKDQVKYLRNTKKPGNMQVNKWFKRIRFINRMLPLLQVYSVHA